MQIVIDIDENVFTRLFDNGIEDYAIVNDDLWAIAKSIRNCIPLPKGHGRLIDLEEVRDRYFNIIKVSNSELESLRMLAEILDTAPTIIEKDKGSEE